MDNETTLYRIQGSRVFGQGMSINCTNIVTATLNQYEQTIHLNNTIGKDLKTIIMDLKILKHDIKKVMEKLEQC